MQPNVLVADAISHRARFAWLAIALAATLTLLLASPPARGSHARSAPAQRSLYQDHGCTAPLRPARVKAERRALREAERAERRARADFFY
jgi:hypothetical protein